MIPHPHRVTGAPATHFNDEALSLLRPQLTLPLLPDTSRCRRSRGVTGYLRWKVSARNKRLVTTALTLPAPPALRRGGRCYGLGRQSGTATATRHCWLPVIYDHTAAITVTGATSGRATNEPRTCLPASLGLGPPAGSRGPAASSGLPGNASMPWGFKIAVTGVDAVFQEPA
jgi:hypothetical protein